MTKLKTTIAAMGLALLASSSMAATSTTSTYAATKYPIVLTPGLLAFPFYQIAQNLQASGATVYDVQNVSAVNSTAVRGEQFVTQLQQILAVSGAQKLNLIGHSQGNQTIRYAAAVMPGQIASVTSVNGVTFGSAVADVIAGLETAVGPTISNAVIAAFNALGNLSNSAQGYNLPQSGQGALDSLTTVGATAFNAQYPAGVPTSYAACNQGAAQVNGVYYFSWGSVGQATNSKDVSDALLEVTALAFGKTPNDGLVAQCANHLGTVIRDNYPDMNHLDAINQLNGLVGTTNPVTLYLQQANRLKTMGL